MKNFLKKLKISLVGYSGALLLWAFRKTLSLKVVTQDGNPIEWSEGKPRVVAFWHAHQLMMPWLYLDPGHSKPKPMHVLISKSTDGRFIAKAMQVLGIGSVAGSSSRGGKEALIQIVSLIKGGSHVAFTPDGPKGPVNKVKVGALKVSQLTGSEILPCCFAAKHCWVFNSWDKMILPKPFSKAIILTGQTMVVPRESTIEQVSELAEKLGEELNRITAEANKLVNA